MRLLSLETSTDDGSCALWQDGELSYRHCPVARSHSETLLPLVAELLAEAGIGFSQLDGIAFGAGPGAFTGLRVACGLTQGFALAHDLPVFPVGTLDALAWAAQAPEVLALIDARMNEVYFARFRRDAEGVTALTPYALAAPEAVILPEQPGLLAVGKALQVYPVLRARAEAAGCRLLDDCLPQATAVAELAVPRLKRGEGLDAALAAPLYVRDKVAQTISERLANGGKA